MFLVSLITFLAFVVYVYLGVYVLRLKPRTNLSWIFFALCMSCAIWAFCIAFMFPAPNQETAWLWFRYSAPGWCLGPALLLHFNLVLTGKLKQPKNRFLLFLIYIPAVVFMFLGMTRGVTATTLIYEDFGWSPLNAVNSPLYWSYALFYVFCIIISIVIVYRWGKKAVLMREKKQAWLVGWCTFMGTLLAFASETLGPALGYTSVPKMPVVLWLVWAYGLWVSITKYRLMVLSPSIAANAIIDSISDLAILINPSGKIINVNQAVNKLLNYQEDVLLNEELKIITAHTGEMAAIQEELQRDAAIHYQVETELKCSNGLLIPVKLTASAVRDDFGDLLCYVLVAQDLRPTLALQNEIRERVRAEEALCKSNLQLKEWSVTLQEQNDKLEFQNAELEAMTQSLAEGNHILEEKNRQLENLFNNVGQGFLSFGEDQLILNENSLECRQILGQNPAGFRLADLLYAGDEEQRDFMQEVFAKVLQESDPDKYDLYLSLLPEEIYLHGRCISIEYKKAPGYRLDENHLIIVILTDITEKRELQRQLEEEKNMFSMVVKTIVNQQDLLKCIEDFQYFIDCELPQLLKENKYFDVIVTDTLRNIHTFKGNFSQFDVSTVVEALHKLETAIIEKRKMNANIAEIISLLQNFDLFAHLDEDLKIVRSMTGQDVLQRKGNFVISEDRLIELEDYMSKILSSSQYDELLHSLKKLKYKSFKELIKSYPEYAERLASRQGKQIFPFNIEGDDILVDSDYFRDFTKSLVHIFRNSIDHGIEDIEERLALGKNPPGSISCHVMQWEQRIILSIADDGRGLNLEKIREKAVQKGLISSEEAPSLSDDQLIELIFVDEFSTHEKSTLLSGRGVGLAAVRTETEKIGGKVRIINLPGQGCQFVFDLPLLAEEYRLSIDLPTIIASLTESASAFLLEQLGLVLNEVDAGYQNENMVMPDTSVLLAIHGVYQAIAIISFSDALSDKLLSIFVADAVNPEEKEQLYPDMLVECANIILGNSMKNWGKYQDLISMVSPVIFCDKGVVIRHPLSQISSNKLEAEDYRMTLSFALINHPSGEENEDGKNTYC
ncbi:ATP-binding protein [Syntrophomonas palmitatica]|uniref:ATP-binding protein n=1 Tax=Syntrophomonas palmitatica TaxID=402877 RepID=UPI0006D0509E|nr:ATP-binding protein [Syntrophomonas palmitatica]